MSIFSTLNTGVSGLGAAQVQISTTGHNITNANSPYYTRQRVVQSAADALHVRAGDIGLGTKVDKIVRIHDEYVFTKLRDNTNNVENTKYFKTKLEEVAQRFPDLKDVGILNDLQQYQKAWNDYASHPADSAMKINLIQVSKTLAKDISATRNDLFKMQNSVNDDIVLTIEEINRIGKDIATINGQIAASESAGDSMANDLRDKRDELELRLSKLVKSQVFKDNLEQNSSFDTNIKDGSIDYHLNIEGFSIVDGTTFHPLKIDSVAAGSPFQRIYYELQDGTTADLTTKLSGGQLGAQLDLRGREFNTQTNKFDDGILQDYINNMDSFAKTLITETNNIYSRAAQKQIISNEVSHLKGDDVIMNADNRLKTGTFDLIVYDDNGKEVARKTITLDTSTSMTGGARSSSLLEKINSNTDDNNDNNTLNDFDDYFTADYSYDETKDSGIFSLIPKLDGYKVGVEDHGTNFPGIFGLGKFFEGTDASNIDVDTSLRHDPTLLRASSSGADGNNDVANAITQLQYDKIKFYDTKGESTEATFEGFYRYITTDIASRAQNNNTLHKTNEAILSNVTAEFQSVSGVDMNEELSNLMKYQASFGASAKIITTVDKMLDTLLGLKQ